jgi:hypothetical protein
MPQSLLLLLEEEELLLLLLLLLLRQTGQAAVSTKGAPVHWTGVLTLERFAPELRDHALRPEAAGSGSQAANGQ